MAFYAKKAVSIVACIAMLLTIHRNACAQTGPTFTLSALTDSAIHFLPSILQKQALVNAASAGVTDARHAALPVLKIHDQIDLATSNGIPGSYFTFGMIPSTSGSIRSSNISQPASGNIAMLYGEYELVNFGLRQARVENAIANQQLKVSDLEKDKYLLKLQVSKLYFTLLRSMFQLGVDQQSINRYQSVYSVIQAVTKSGIKPGVDSSLALAELSKAQIAYTKRAGDIRQLQQQLAYLTGISGSIQIDTTEKKYDMQEPALNTGTADTSNNPIIDYYRRQKDAYVAAGNLIKKSYLPKILLVGGGWARGSSIDDNDNYKALSSGLGYQRYNYMAGLTFTYNLFDGIHRKDKLRVNDYDVQANDYGLQQQQLALQTATRQSETALQIADQNLTRLPIQLQAATDAYDQKLAQYKAGVINLVDLTNANFVLYSAQTDFLEALNDRMQALLDKAAATGTLDQFIQSIKN